MNDISRKLLSIVTLAFWEHKLTVLNKI